MERPQVFVAVDEDEDVAAQELRRRVFEVGARPFVLTSTHGRRLAAALTEEAPSDSPPATTDLEWAHEFAGRIRDHGADLIVAVGGGRTLDIAKLAAARAGILVMTVPTQLSHDGICSPVAVMVNESGTSDSIGAIAPRAVFVSLATLRGAPAPALAAGIGDLLANPLALRDWALAAERGLESLNQRAWDLSVESFRAIEPDLDSDTLELIDDPDFLQRLADALILSGMAMLEAGSSRPASGAEHEIAHAVEELYGGRALHGAQVAFGCIFSVALYGDDHRAFRERLLRLGLPQNPKELGLSHEDLVKVLLHAPRTRPGRFTILEASDLDEAGAAALVKEIWG